MEVFNRKALFERNAPAYVNEVVLPRLETLRQALGNSHPVKVSSEGTSVCLGLRSSVAFSVGADLSFAAGHDPEIRSLECSWKVSVIPILMDYDREARISLNGESPDKERLSRFVDVRILRFVTDYLRIHGPDSPYVQENVDVHDPVCDMAFPASEAVSSLMVGHRTYYFCAEECADKFESDRKRYSTDSGR
jgi:YHS domain-containing protein